MTSSAKDPDATGADPTDAPSVDEVRDDDVEAIDAYECNDVRLSTLVAALRDGSPMM